MVVLIIMIKILKNMVHNDGEQHGHHFADIFKCILLNEIFCILIKISLNTLRPRQNGRRFTDDTFKRIFLNENVKILIKISLKFIPRGPINNITALVQIMAWRRPGDKPLSEPMMISLQTHICVTRPQWVKFVPEGRMDNKSALVQIIPWCRTDDKSLHEIILYYIWGCVFSVYPFPLWWLREHTLCLIIIIKSEVWSIIHCLGLGHETMVCSVCFSIFLLTRSTMASVGHNELTHWGLVTPYGDKRSGSTLAQVMACCLTAPSHYLNQCWLILSKVQWHSSGGNFIRDTPAINH